jgi:hypothetical protein
MNKIEVNEEKRIYVVVPVTVTGQKGVVKQPLGRQAAQAVHVVSKMRVLREAKDLQTWLPITTIILAARDQKETEHVWTLLKRRNIDVTHFADSNPDYGVMHLVTAICTEPIYKKGAEGVLDYLPLWPGEQK